mmetsp:Transcript_16417/g.23358  ORF Transcript_16417/g.23358 Transcript_16417/m.23358 type:complete len:159 (+) Transcript_16417:216-692(+)
MTFARKKIIEALRVTVTGASTVLFSTVVSCGLAVAIESAANQTLYKLFPHWYRDVKYAMGLPHLKYQNCHNHYLDETNNSPNSELDDITIGNEATALPSKTIDDVAENIQIVQISNEYITPPILQYRPINDNFTPFERIKVSPERVSKMVLSCAMTSG